MNKAIRIIALVIALVATFILTGSMFLISSGIAYEVVLYESNIYISSFESLMGLFSVVVLLFLLTGELKE